MMQKLLLWAFGLLSSVNVFAANPVVELKTTQGTIVVELYPDKAPKTVDNFVQYVKDGFYDGTVFHRVIDGFMIQGGGFTQKMEQKPTRPPVAHEGKNGLKNEPGTIAMARTQDPNSASAQFFINLVDNRALNYPSPDGWGYTVFGKVTKGFEIVQQIGKVKTGNPGFLQNVPLTPVVIQSVRLVTDLKAK